MQAAPPTRAERIARLESAIEQDHRTLEALVSDERTEDARALHEHPELRAIAERLGQHEQELARLESLERAESRSPESDSAAGPAAAAPASDAPLLPAPADRP